jgi:hypothetical protein
MSTDNVTAIDPFRAAARPIIEEGLRTAIFGPRRSRKSSKPSAAAPRATLPAVVVERLEQAREMVFQAHSIAAVAAAAAVSEMPADEHCTETTLRHVAELLDKAAAMLDPINLTRVAS